MDFQQFSNVQLLGLYAQVMQELKSRGVLRSMNNPVGDYAEKLAEQVLNAKIQPQSTEGYDLIGQDGLRYQVKARRLTSKNNSRQLSFLRDLPDQKFDFLVGILFAEDFSVLKAALIPWALVYEKAVYREKQHVWIFHLKDFLWELPTVQNLVLSDVAVPEELLEVASKETSAEAIISEFQETDVVADCLTSADTAVSSFAEYFKSHRELFDTKPRCIEFQGKRVSLWHSTRLMLLRDGVELLAGVDSGIIVQYIKPGTVDYGYQEGLVIMPVDELRREAFWISKLQSKSYCEKGRYNWPTLPKEVLEKYFYPC